MRQIVPRRMVGTRPPRRASTTGHRRAAGTRGRGRRAGGGGGGRGGRGQVDARKGAISAVMTTTSTQLRRFQMRSWTGWNRSPTATTKATGERTARTSLEAVDVGRFDDSI